MFVRPRASLALFCAQQPRLPHVRVGNPSLQRLQPLRQVLSLPVVEKMLDDVVGSLPSEAFIFRIQQPGEGLNRTSQVLLQHAQGRLSYLLSLPDQFLRELRDPEPGVEDLTAYLSLCKILGVRRDRGKKGRWTPSCRSPLPRSRPP